MMVKSLKFYNTLKVDALQALYFSVYVSHKHKFSQQSCKFAE